MKKWLIAILLLLLILLTCVYFLIPRSVNVYSGVSIRVNPQALYRTLSDQKTWTKWWPAAGRTQPQKDGEQSFFFSGFRYTITDQKISSLIISIAEDKFSTTSSLYLFPAGEDSTNIIWQAAVPTSTFPTKRLQAYIQSKQLEKAMDALLQRLADFASKTENLYGSAIRQEAIMDSTLVSTYSFSKGYPTTPDIYNLIARLRNYIISQGARERGFPMLNISTSDSISYTTKVAIPVDKQLTTSGNISYKWMMGGGKILVTEVHGGNDAINQGLRRIEDYLQDNHLVAPAIPFQSLVTDRQQQPDSTKWITKIVYPVM